MSKKDIALEPRRGGVNLEESSSASKCFRIFFTSKYLEMPFTASPVERLVSAAVFQLGRTFFLNIKLKPFFVRGPKNLFAACPIPLIRRNEIARVLFTDEREIRLKNINSFFIFSPKFVN